MLSVCLLSEVIFFFHFLDVPCLTSYQLDVDKYVLVFMNSCHGHHGSMCALGKYLCMVNIVICLLSQLNVKLELYALASGYILMIWPSSEFHPHTLSYLQFKPKLCWFCVYCLQLGNYCQGVCYQLSCVILKPLQIGAYACVWCLWIWVGVPLKTCV